MNRFLPHLQFMFQLVNSLSEQAESEKQCFVEAAIQMDWGLSDSACFFSEKKKMMSGFGYQSRQIIWTHIIQR